jgi:3-deoxy-D-manno-octulosonate 8-phosphate phosphatase (KDO 8-P phosphatase)
MENRLEEPAELYRRLAQVRLLAMDVDGVLTDATIGYDSQGAHQKRFHIADGLGLVVLRQVGIHVAWISGRADAAVERRAVELRIEHLLQGIRDKGHALQTLRADLALGQEEVAFLGDDWNDLLAFEVAGVRLAVANAAAEVKERADAVTLTAGGKGAVREVCEAILEARGLRASGLQVYLDSLRTLSASEPPGQ